MRNKVDTAIAWLLIFQTVVVVLGYMQSERYAFGLAAAGWGVLVTLAVISALDPSWDTS